MFKQHVCDVCGGKFFGPSWHTRCRHCFDPHVDAEMAAHEQEVRKFLKQARKKRNRRCTDAPRPAKAPRQVQQMHATLLLASPPARRRSIGYAALTEIVPRPCTACSRLVDGECRHYGRKMPEPARPCRCVHFIAVLRNVFDFSVGYPLA